MHYMVEVVEDHELPTSTDWAIVRTIEATYLFIKRSRFSIEGGLPSLLVAAWTAWTTYTTPLPVAV